MRYVTSARRAVAVLAATTTCGLVLMGQQAPSAAPSAPLGVAHRGANTQAPENTLHAFDRAFADGGTAVETDVQFDRNQAPIISHDPTTTRTTDCRDTIKWWTLAQMARCNAAKGWPYFERMPTLYEQLSDVARHHGTTYIEIKPAATAGQTAGMLDRWRWTNAYSWATAISFIPADLDLVHAADPRIRTMLLTTTLPSLTDVAAYDGVDVAWTALTPAFVQQMHAAGKKVGAWTADTPPAWQKLADMHVDSITTDVIGAYQLWAAHYRPGM